MTHRSTPRALGGWLIAALAVAASVPAAAQVSLHVPFNAATASVMQGSLAGGPNASCTQTFPASFTFHDGDPGEDFLYQSYTLYNNGPARCVEVNLEWIGADCGDLEIGLSLYLGSFDPSNPTLNLISHSHDFEYQFSFGDPSHYNDYRQSPGFFRDAVQAYHLDSIYASVPVPALAKVIVVLDSLAHPGSTRTCPIDPSTAELRLESNQLSDTPLSVSVDDTSSYEFDPPGGAKLAFYVSLSTQLAVPFSVHYQTSSITATPGTDYVETGGTVDFAAGQTLKLVEVPIVSDLTQEPTQTLALTLSSPNPSIPLAKASAVGTIFDDDDPNAGCRITSFPTGPLPPGTVGQTYGPIDLAPAGGDLQDQYEWTIASGTLPPGIDLSTSNVGGVLHGVLGSAPVPPLTPTQAGDFAFTVHLVCPLIDNGFDSTDVAYTIHIEPERPPVILTLDSTSVIEGNLGLTPALPLIKLSAPLPDDLVLEVETSDASATVANSDYQPVVVGQQILIPKGETVEPIPLDVVGDPTVEPDEKFIVRLKTPIQKTVLASAVVGVINDDAVAVSIPTLDQWGLLALALALGVLGVGLGMRKKSGAGARRR